MLTHTLCSARVVINLIQDYLQSRLVYYLTNLHIKPRSIWLSRVCQHPHPFITLPLFAISPIKYNTNFLTPLPHFFSMVNPNTTSKGKLAAMPT